MNRAARFAAVGAGVAIAAALIVYYIVGYLVVRPPAVAASGKQARASLTLQTVASLGSGAHPDWVSYLARRQARMDGTVAALSDREFRVLHYLAVHAGEVVSRERLLADVWGYSFDPGSNVVDVCIRRLRKKLGPDTPIETVRHAGYRLAAA